MEREVVMPSALLVASVTVALAASQAPASPQAAAPRTPLKIVHQVPVATPSVQNPELKPVQVQLDAVVAADGAVSDVRLVSVSVVSPKVEMTADPAVLRSDFDAMVRAASDSVRQWRFEAPAESPATVRVPVRFDPGVSQTTLGTIRPLAGYPPTVGPVLPRGVLKVGDAVKPPRRLVNAAPTYPQEAIDAKVQGVVVLDVLVDAEGVPSDVQVVQGIPMLDAAAIEAVRKWRYEPTLMNGVAVPIAMTVSLNFSLDQ
jgi:TonB family protein